MKNHYIQTLAFMENNYNNYFRVHPIMMWFLVGINYIAAIGFGFDGSSMTDSLFLLGLVFGIALLTWIIFLSDVMSSKIYNQSTWILLIALTPLLAYPFYLFQRKRLFNLQRKRERFTERESSER